MQLHSQNIHSPFIMRGLAWHTAKIATATTNLVAIVLVSVINERTRLNECRVSISPRYILWHRVPPLCPRIGTGDPKAVNFA